MASIDFLSRECRELFSSYPLAVRSVDLRGTMRSMILMLRDGNNTEFFALSHEYYEGQSLYSLRPWPSEENAGIGTDEPDILDVAVKVLTWGVPFPWHGSLLGWTRPGYVTALIVFYTRCTPSLPKPYWSVMPLAGAPEEQWPPFTAEPYFGNWFWEYHRAGNISSLRSLIAAAPNAVFWAATETVLGSRSCAVGRDLRSPEGYILPRGRYVYYQALRAGKPVPPLPTLLADVNKIDLATQFQQYRSSNG